MVRMVAEKRVGIESVWELRGHPVFKFKGVDSMTEAEKLQGYELRIPLEERAPAPEGEYFHSRPDRLSGGGAVR